MPEVEKAPLTDEGKEARAKLLEECIEDALSISHRFSPEPVFGPTGKGYLKSEGVEELNKWKKSEH